MNFGRIIFLSLGIFDVSGGIKSATAHTQKVRKEPKQIDVISSWGFHYVQVNYEVSAKECCLNTSTPLQRIP